MSSVKKFQIDGPEHLIHLMSKWNVKKEIVIENIEKYGLVEDTNYILQQLGFKPVSQVKISQRIIEQANLFKFIFDTNRDCYVRLRNKKTGKYYSYNVKALKNVYKLQNILEQKNIFSENTDIMYSLNTYNNMYKATNESIFSIHLLAIDVDFDTKKMTVEQCLEKLANEYDRTIPKPNLIEYGHRIRLLYKVESVGATAKSKHLAKRITNKIAEKLKGYGASGQALTTYGRIFGSINSEDNSTIQIKKVKKDPYFLRKLKYEVLEEPPKKVKNINRKVAKIETIYSLNMARLNDLERIQKVRDVGYREILCFLYRNFCVLAGEKDPLQKMLQFNANFEVPQAQNKIDQDTRNVERNPYYLKNQWILNELGITPEEEEELGLETIMSKTEKMRRNNELNKSKYRKKHPISKKEKMDMLRKEILDFKKAGYKNKDIINKLNISLSTLQRHLRYLRKKNAL